MGAWGGVGHGVQGEERVMLVRHGGSFLQETGSDPDLVNHVPFRPQFLHLQNGGEDCVCPMRLWGGSDLLDEQRGKALEGNAAY